jgi:hypothetical protein
VTGHIYCAVGQGTGVNPAAPNTWHGALSVSVVGVTMEASYFGGTVAIHGSSNPTFEPCGYSPTGYTASGCGSLVPKPSSTLNYPLIYAVSNAGAGGTTGQAAYIDGGNSTIDGDVFAPNGLLYFTGGGTGNIGFLQGWDVTVKGGGLSGDGPLANSSGGFTPTVSLLQ